MTNQPFSFGSSGRYYATVFADGERLFGMGTSQEAFALSNLLKNYDPDLRLCVERTFKQCNNILREYLRSEMGLKLSVGDDSQSVPVRVVAGLPKPLAEIYTTCSPDLWQLLLRLPLLENTARGLSFSAEHYPLLERWIFYPANGFTMPSRSDICTVRDGFEVILKALGKLRIREQLRAIDQDVLGAYFFRVPAINLYWMALGLVAGLLGIGVDALTVVVAAHELAHAYSHLGRDIDGGRWQTESFARADAGIVEGLAQFYTEAVCRKLESRFPVASRAYGALLDLQSGAYLAHKEWIQDTSPGATPIAWAGEVIRASMIECRVRNFTERGDFDESIQRHRISFQVCKK